MLKNAIAYAEICGIYAKFCICGIIFAYAILKMTLYAEKYAICRFLAKYAIAYTIAIVYSHITNIPKY